MVVVVAGNITPYLIFFFLFFSLPQRLHVCTIMYIYKLSDYCLNFVTDRAKGHVSLLDTSRTMIKNLSPTSLEFILSLINLHEFLRTQEMQRPSAFIHYLEARTSNEHRILICHHRGRSLPPPSLPFLTPDSHTSYDTHCCFRYSFLEDFVKHCCTAREIFQ